MKFPVSLPRSRERVSSKSLDRLHQFVTSQETQYDEESLIRPNTESSWEIREKTVYPETKETISGLNSKQTRIENAPLEHPLSIQSETPPTSSLKEKDHEEELTTTKQIIIEAVTNHEKSKKLSEKMSSIFRKVSGKTISPKEILSYDLEQTENFIITSIQTIGSDRKRDPNITYQTQYQLLEAQRRIRVLKSKLTDPHNYNHVEDMPISRYQAQIRATHNATDYPDETVSTPKQEPSPTPVYEGTGENLFISERQESRTNEGSRNQDSTKPAVSVQQTTVIRSLNFIN